ncbi:hypothetical protein [Ralstonia phage RP31]|uniref:Uncharacterized protein n=1 Tax=Ralstonia phage RP31 TaxID=1923890 RepID=A0A1L7N1F8_9CAUD|nr:hypothetical protein [Ralstonia phage RP31]
MAALEALDSTAALEAFSLRAVANRAADIIPNLSHAFNEVLSSYKGDKYDLRPLSVNKVVLDKALDGANYLEVGKLNVFVPQGFIGNFKQYLGVLDQALNFTNSIQARMVEFNQLVSAMITDKNTRQSTKDLSTATSSMERQREAVREQLDGFQLGGSRSDRALLQNTFSSLNEIKECVFLAADLLSRANQVTLNEVEVMTRDAAELLKALGEQAMEGKVEGMSPEAYKNLSSATLTMARDVELHALLMYTVYQVKKSVEHTSEALIQALRY